MSDGVVISPHLDDAVLSCWLPITRGTVSRVVTVFAGIPPDGLPTSPWDSLTGAVSSSARMRERRQEDRAALAPTACEVVHLDHLDSEYRQHTVDTSRLRRDLERATRDAGEVWLPAGIGWHPDHITTRNVALLATGGRRQRLYAELPYAVMYGPPGSVRSEQAGPYLDVDRWIQAQLRLGRLDPARLRPRVDSLRSEERQSKHRAIAAYATQLPALVVGFGGHLRDEATMSYEWSWELE